MQDDLAPRSLTLRAMEPADLAAAHALTAAIAWPYRPEDWRLLFELGMGHVACDGPRVIGTAMSWRHGDAATIGLVLVAADRQGRGIGRRLVRAALDALGDCAVQLHATPAGLPLYESLGFRAAGLVHQHQGILAADPPEPEDRRLREARPDDHGAIVALDAVAFGTARAVLLESLLAQGQAWVLEEHGALQGAVLRRRFGRGVVIGPVLATHEQDAITLIARALRDGGDGIHRVDIPAAAGELGAWLTRLGLPVVDRAVTMLRGDWPRSHTKMRRFALASQALG